LICSTAIDRSPENRPDYETEEVLVVGEPAQLRALADAVRTRIVLLLSERARSTTELAAEVGLAKGTVAHHLRVLEQAGLIRVVRTRRVRAVTERFYGRAARLFVIRSHEPPPAGARPSSVAAAGLRHVAGELDQTSELGEYALLHVRLAPADAKRFQRRLDRLAEAVRAAERSDGEPTTFAGVMFRSPESP
jgi:DNA-binding transcriptional ArsR family regulator